MSNFHNNYNLLLNNSTHPIIKQDNTFSLNRKLLTVHAVDREKHFYSNSNFFSIKTPQPYTNVESLRLTEINFPTKINNFSKNLNNNVIKIKGKDIIIPDGNYSYDDIAKFLSRSGDGIKVKYLVNLQRFIFYSDTMFYLTFNLKDRCNNGTRSNTNGTRSNNTINAFKHEPTLLINEGFFHDIGFNINLEDNEITEQKISERVDTSRLADVSANILINFIDGNELSGNSYFIITESPPRFKDQQPIYMEIDSINVNYDELDPFPSGTNNTFSNFNNSSTKSAFIKIPPCVFNNPDFSDFNFFQNTVAFFEAPLKRIQNFKFKFRYHDNILVDLDNQDVNFTLEINQLRSNMHRDMKIQTPIL
jgi:hypothetical protein